MNQIKLHTSRIILIAVIFYTSTACNFDSMFLLPYKLLKAKEYSIVINDKQKDTLIVVFDKISHSPSIKHKGKDYDAPYTIESMFFENNRKNRLYGWFLKPLGKEADATILFLHGNAGHILSHYTIVHHLAKQGFQVFLFDYSGFGFSEGTATRKHVLEDACSAFDYMYKRDDVRKTKVVIYGQSLGGNLAPVLGCKKNEYVDAVVIEGGFSSHDDIAAYTTNLGILARIGVREQYRAKKAVRKWHKPILVIHSKEDSIIPYSMGETIYRNANLLKFFYSINKPHITGPVYYSDSISAKIRSMF